ncbi:MAG: DUF1848 family protein [Thermodesulfobacteriota bacterium]
MTSSFSPPRQPGRAAPPQYLSVSRRTDIPRFFAAAFLDAWQAGTIRYDGGYGRQYEVSLRPEDVFGYIFWSKDFAPLVADPRFERLIEESNAIFHFTINDCSALEPRVAPLKERLATLARLCALVGPERVVWRFDPICRYLGPQGAPAGNEAAFSRILPPVAGLGIRRCVFSFMADYPKLRQRPVHFLPVTREEKAAIAGAMLAACRQAGLDLFACCQPEIPALVPGIRAAACVDDAVLAATDRFGRHRPQPAKPTRPGCGCHASRDIGSYDQRCRHGCLYCYANPLLARR